jgi:hypothetical protein
VKTIQEIYVLLVSKAFRNSEAKNTCLGYNPSDLPVIIDGILSLRISYNWRDGKPIHSISLWAHLPPPKKQKEQYF